LASRSSLRAQLARARNKAVRVEEWPADRAVGSPLLASCLQGWLGSRGLPPLHFLVESDTLTNLRDRRTFVATRDDRVIGFVVGSPIPLRDGWLIEQVVRRPEAPNGTAELLLDAAIRRLGEAGSDHVALGAAPLSERAGRIEVSPVVRGVLAWARAHTRRFYNFAGLEAFKAKFNPDWWEPVYAIAREPRFSLGTLWAVAGAYAGGSPLWAGLAAAGYAVKQELEWVSR
jgi:phosphatidylglycerol lysyltransferase